MAVSLILYVGDLGFYYDDYSVLERMRSSDDQSLFGYYDAVRPATGQRPLQALTFAALYWLFGLDPLGYHVSNACLLFVVAGLLYLVLRELRLPRLLCVSVPLVYSTLPHYATNRFWLDAFQINVSTAFYLLSLYAGLRAIRSSSPALIIWIAIAVLGVPGSLFAYEVIFPLFALNVGLIWWVGRRRRFHEVSDRAVALTTGTLLVAIVGAGIAKLAAVAQHGQNTYGIGFEDSVPHHLAYLVSGAIKLNVGTYLLALPYVLWWIVRHEFSAGNAVVAAIAGILALAYVLHVARLGRETLAKAATWRYVVGASTVAFVLGYAIFLTNQQILFRSAGIDNRVNSGAALGLAGLLVGGIGWLIARLDARRRAPALAVAVACAVASGVFVINTLSSFWTTAARHQREILADIRRDAGELPRSSTLILDGSCPEQGPAIVFADQWDLRAALKIAYRDPSLTADVASEGMQATQSGLAIRMTFLDRVFIRTYPYGRRLIVYDSKRRRLYRLRDRAQAIRYLADSRPSFRCKPQRSFAWGFDPSRRWTLL